MKAIFNIRGVCYQNMNLVRHMCSNKEISRFNQQIATPGTDFLLQNLKNASNTKNVLELVSQHNKIMNNKHIIQALRSLFTLQKCGSSNFSTNEILKHPNFSKLCHRLKQNAGGIELFETIEALKVVTYVGVPSNSTIIQVLLQLIRHNANHLSLQQIIFMDFLLCQFRTATPLIEALKIALPIIFEINLPSKLDLDNLNQLTECLFYASRNRLSFEAAKPIITALSTRYQHFDAKVAKSVIWSLCDMGPNENSESLLTKALRCLNVHLDDLNYVDIETTLSKLVANYSSKFDFYYDEIFFDSCCNYVIDHDLGFKNAIYILRKLARLHHVNNALLDYMAGKVRESPDLILKGDMADVYSIAISVTLSEYRPFHWDFIVSLIESLEDVAASDRREIIWIKFAAALCMINIFKPDVLSKCLNEIYLKDLFKYKFMNNYENFLTIWHSVQLYKPELAFLLPKRFAPEITLSRFKQEVEFPLEGALQKGLGNPKFVKTGLYSKTGYQIDHAIAFNKREGFPVAINSPENVEFIEDLDPPQDSQLVLIQNFDCVRYTINNRQIKCSTLLEMKVLESKGFTVVPVCLDAWEDLQDFEKIPYLMQAIKEKLDSDGFSISESVI